MKLLTFSGDNACARGLRGPHWNMLEEFHHHWERIDTICPPHPKARPMTLFGNVHFHPLPPRRWSRWRHLLSMGRERIADERPDLIVAHDYFPFHHGSTARRLTQETGIPHILEVFHIEGYPKTADLGEWLRCQATARYIAGASRKAAALRVINKTQVPDWLVRHGVAEEKIILLYSSYTDFDLFHPADVNESQDIDVLFVGRLVRNKGLEPLIDAVATLDPVPRTLLIGTGPLRDSLVERVQRAGAAERIQFHGWAQDAAEIASFMRRSRLLVCASLSEGGPRTTLEAMACGIPVVSTPVGTMPDIIEHRVSGCLSGFAAHDLRAEIHWLLEDPSRARAVGRAGREAIQSFERRKLIRDCALGYQSMVKQ